MKGQVIAITAEEIDALHGVGPLSFQAYVLLRTWMDYGTGITGRSRPISLAMLRAYCETHTPRGAGVQITAPSEKEVRTALARLHRVGLLRRLPGDRLAFRLPLAAVACARPNQTGHGAGAERSTEPDTAKAAPLKAKRREPGTVNAQCRQANPAHIMVHENQNQQHPPERSVDKREPASPNDSLRDLTDIRNWLADKWFPGERAHQAEPPAQRLRKDGFAEGIRACPPASAEETRLLTIGRRKGKEPRPGESWAAFRARLFANDQPKISPHRAALGAGQSWQ